MRIFRRCLDWKAERRLAALRSAFFSSSVRGAFGVVLPELDAEAALPFPAVEVVDAVPVLLTAALLPVTGTRRTPPPLMRWSLCDVSPLGLEWVSSRAAFEAVRFL